MTVHCHGCGKLTTSPYWITAKGMPSQEPRCPECHEQDVRNSAQHNSVQESETCQGYDYRDYIR